jgi:thiol:disulfide interchange protein DsbD
MKQRFLFAMTMVTLCVAPAVAQLSMAGPAITSESYAAQDGVAPGEVIRVAFSFNLPKPWHVNSHTPLDEFLIPTELTLAEDAAYTVEQIVYPEHEEIVFAFQEEPLAVYEGNFTIGAVVRVGADAQPGPLVITGSLRYQACNDKQCAPPKNVDVSVAVRVVAAGTAAADQHADVFAAIDWDSEGMAPAEEEATQETVTKTEGPTVTGDWEALADDFSIATRTEYVDTEGFLAFIERAESGAPADEGYFAGMAWWLIIVSVLAGGLALNLTPCVLPLIPINIAIIGAGAKAGSKARGFALGGA